MTTSLAATERLSAEIAAKLARAADLDAEIAAKTAAVEEPRTP